MEFSHMISKIFFLHFFEIIGGFMKIGGKAYQLFDEGVVVSTLSETRTSVIEMIWLNWMQHLNEVMMINIVTSIIPDEEAFNEGISIICVRSLNELLTIDKEL